MKKVYYIGDWAVQLGPVYAETPFNYAAKGTEVINYGRWLKEALESGNYEVTSVPTWDFYMLKPGEWEHILDEYDVIIFSDVEAKNFQLAPGFFKHQDFGTKVLTFPDRINLTVDAVERGKIVLFLGGWLSFNGEMGKGGWGRTSLNKILPVECLPYEDLVESTEGFTPGTWDTGVSIFENIQMHTMPPILGYNRVQAKENCPILATWSTGDPMLAYGRFGRGFTVAYTSDPAPHWGCNFVFWDGYKDFWCNIVRYFCDLANH